jgi:hypothetical protein
MSFYASEAAHCHFELAALDAHGLTVQQSIGDFPPCRIQQAGKGAAGDVHLMGSFFLIESFKVVETYCLDFFHKQMNLFKCFNRCSRRLEIIYLWYRTDPSPALLPSICLSSLF